MKNTRESLITVKESGENTKYKIDRRWSGGQMGAGEGLTAGLVGGGPQAPPPLRAGPIAPQILGAAGDKVHTAGERDGPVRQPVGTAMPAGAAGRSWNGPGWPSPPACSLPGLPRTVLE